MKKGLKLRIIHGEADAIVPISNSQRLEAALDATGQAGLLTQLPRCAHLPHEEDPEGFVRLVGGFIAGCESGSK